MTDSSKRTIQYGILAWVVIIGIIWGAQCLREKNGDFSMSPGETRTYESHQQVALVPDAGGKQYTNVRPLAIEAPDCIEVEVIGAGCGGYYLNGGWMAKSVITYRVTARPNAPRGVHNITTKFPAYTDVVMCGIR